MLKIPTLRLYCWNWGIAWLAAYSHTASRAFTKCTFRTMSKGKPAPNRNRDTICCAESNKEARVMSSKSSCLVLLHGVDERDPSLEDNSSKRARFASRSIFALSAISDSVRARVVDSEARTADAASRTSSGQDAHRRTLGRPLSAPRKCSIKRVRPPVILKTQ